MFFNVINLEKNQIKLCSFCIDIHSSQKLDKYLLKGFGMLQRLIAPVTFFDNFKDTHPIVSMLL